MHICKRMGNFSRKFGSIHTREGTKAAFPGRVQMERKWGSRGKICSKWQNIFNVIY